MMSPTIILRDGELLAGLGSAGSNRIRSAIVQVILRLVKDGMSAREAVDAPRVHYESGILSAEPGIDPDALARLEAAGATVDRWDDRNMFFGGVQAVARNPETAEVNAAGDPRRGGAVAFA
jgi:gamma-glutamyltranspeptidase/glutathione hydrolase